MPDPLLIPAPERRAVRLAWRALLANKAHELWTKARGRRIKGQGMIGAPAGVVQDGFSGLAADGFEEYNLPQAWVESRMIPQALHGRVPRAGARILDLGCGPGTSTRLLAHFADPSWFILGMDLTPALIDAARLRAQAGAFRNAAGQTIPTAFVRQDLAAPLRGPDDTPVPDASIDLAISCGVVGLYMDTPGATALAHELARVLRPGGFAALDAGPAIPVPALRQILAGAGLTPDGTCRSVWCEPRPKLVYRKPA